VHLYLLHTMENKQSDREYVPYGNKYAKRKIICQSIIVVTQVK